ncbi:MAG: sugar ABC transporter permease [Anaerolineae bacterium]|nr:sugar ABC transporter permease [Anaerolineae bacterium]
MPRGTHNVTVSLQQRIADLAYGLLLPTFLIVFAIIIFPTIWNLVFSLRPIKMRDLADASIFSLEGLTLDNFDRVFSTRGGQFWDIMLTTLVYTFFGSVLAIFLGLVAALVAKDSFPGRGIFRGFMLFPYIAPVISLAFIWEMLLNSRFGFINEIVASLGGTRVDFLTTPGWALLMIILFQGWRYFPFSFLFILARIQAIPDDMYEAAKVDGAAPSERLWFITLPQLRAVFGTLFLLRFIWTFNKFDDVFLLTGGVAGTEVVPVQIYNWLFSRQNVGTASATAIVMAVILFGVVAIYFRWFLVAEEV